MIHGTDEELMETMNIKFVKLTVLLHIIKIAYF